jgi:hypothetical protein
VKFAGHNFRLVRIYLPFTPLDTTNTSPLSPGQNTPFIQLALCPGDSASLYRLKQDVFTALTTGLGVLSSLSPIISIEDSSHSVVDQRYTSAAASRAAETGGLGTPPRGSSGRVRKSFTFEIPSKKVVNMSPPPSISEVETVSTPDKATESTISNNLKTASGVERAKLIARLTAAAATCRRIPLPPRHRIRPRNNRISPLKNKGWSSQYGSSTCEEADDDNGDEGVVDEEEDGERRFAMSVVEETAEFSEDLRTVIDRLKSGCGGVTSHEMNTPVPTPTPFRFSASFISWGPSGAGVEIAAEMVKKGVDAFAWRWGKDATKIYTRLHIYLKYTCV